MITISKVIIVKKPESLVIPEIITIEWFIKACQSGVLEVKPLQMEITLTNGFTYFFLKTDTSWQWIKYYSDKRYNTGEYDDFYNNYRNNLLRDHKGSLAESIDKLIEHVNYGPFRRLDETGRYVPIDE